MRSATFEWLATAVVGVALAAARGSAGPAGDPPALPHAVARDLLARSDVSTLAPASFRARLTLTPTKGDPLDLEVWRAGETKTLVRFLGRKDRGKYLLRLDDALYFLSPKAKKPVKLDPAYRVGAVSLDEMLGTRYSRDYEIVGVSLEQDGALVDLELRALGPNAPWPKVLYVVERATRRPVRAEFYARSGRKTGAVEFLEWSTAKRLRPKRLRVEDAVRKSASADVLITEVDERPVPNGLFDKDDPSERRKLEAAGRAPKE
jgi:hypothetical protein